MKIKAGRPSGTYEGITIKGEVSNEIKRLKKMRKGCNNVEINRIDIAIMLLKKHGIKDIMKTLNTGDKTITNIKKKYQEGSTDFFKTNYKGRKSIYDKEIEKAKEIIKEGGDKNEGYSILEMSEKLGFGLDEKGYFKTWHILRKRMKCRYQKPYVKDKKAAKNNKEILKKNCEINLKKKK